MRRREEKGLWWTCLQCWAWPLVFSVAWGMDPIATLTTFTNIFAIWEITCFKHTYNNQTIRWLLCNSSFSLLRSLIVFCNENQASTNSHKAELFNEYFYSVYTCSNQQINDCERTAGPGMLWKITIYEFEVFEILTCLDSSKVCGIDNISTAIVLHLSQVVCHFF